MNLLVRLRRVRWGRAVVLFGLFCEPPVSPRLVLVSVKDLKSESLIITDEMVVGLVVVGVVLEALSRG